MSARASAVDRARRSAAAVAMAAGLFAVLAAGTRAQAEVPVLVGRVNDYADLLPTEAEAALEARLKTLEDETGAQVVVLTVPSLAGDPIEDFSIRVVERWRLGREDADDGVLILVAADDRALRIEVGYGLEPVLTDLRSRRIISEIMVPRFRDGDFAGGITAGADAVASVIRGQELPAAPAPDEPDTLREVLLGVLFMLLWVTLAGGIVGWLVTAALTPVVYWLVESTVGGYGWWGVLGWWAAVFVLRRLFGGPLARGRRMRSGWPDAFGRGGFGGFSGGSGGGSGGFSGGGGSFGGGGASGRW